uniref:Uncharacterized protein n=1 Tax=Leersia perrieri TaxID=77586 RepID=A0A0D9WR89_9ORYZ
MAQALQAAPPSLQVATITAARSETPPSEHAARRDDPAQEVVPRSLLCWSMVVAMELVCPLYIELSCEVNELKAKFAAQQEESDRKLEAERRERLQLELKIQEEQHKERELRREKMAEMLKDQLTTWAQ